MDNNNQPVEERITNLEKRIAALESSALTSSPVVSSAPIVKRISAKEFLISKKISSAMEKTLALAYYLEHFERVTPINVKDLANAFQAAKEKSPANLNDMINKNIAKGMLMEARERKDAKKAWVLTTSGEKFVKNNLNN